MKRLRLPWRVRMRLATLRWTIRGYVLLEGLAVLVVWLGLTFWAGLALDYLPVMVGASEMPLGVRASLLLVIAVVLGWLLYRWVLSRTFAQLANHNMAVLLERHYPGFRDSLLTAVELSEQPDHAEDFNEDMLGHTSNEAMRALKRVRLTQVFRLSPLLSKLVLAIVMIVSIGLFSQMRAEAFDLWVKRMYLLQDDPWPRNTQIEVVGVEITRDTDLTTVSSTEPLVTFGENQQIKVAKGASAKVLVRANADKVLPEKCTIYYRTSEGDRGRVDMQTIGEVTDGYQTYSFSGKPFRGILSNLTFDVRGNDHRIRDYTLNIVDSPAVVATQLNCTYPAYLLQDEIPLVTELDLAAGRQLPRGTKVRITCTSNKKLERVDLVSGDEQGADEDSLQTLEIDSTNPQQFSYVVDSLDDQFSLDVILHDKDGVSSERPHRIVIAGIPDQPPSVNVRLRGIGSAVTPEVVIPVDGTVKDDYGVARRWFQVEMDEQPNREFPIVEAGIELQDRLDFRQLKNDEVFELSPKTKMRFSVKAADRYDLGSGPNIGAGDIYELDVVTADELLTILDRQELGLRRRFEQIIDEMIELRDSLARVTTKVSDPTTSAPEDDEETLTPEQLAERQRSLNLLRTQRAETQSQKSSQEVLGVATAFEDIAPEIENNRVDSEDRKSRLTEQIATPLHLVVESMYPALDVRLTQLGKALAGEEASGEDAAASIDEVDDVDALAAEALRQADDVLIELDKVLQKMLELEDFNALVNLVRQIIDEQKEMTLRTKDARSSSVLDLLK